MGGNCWPKDEPSDQMKALYSTEYNVRHIFVHCLLAASFFLLTRPVDKSICGKKPEICGKNGALLKEE